MTIEEFFQKMVGIPTPNTAVNTTPTTLESITRVDTTPIPAPVANVVHVAPPITTSGLKLTPQLIEDIITPYVSNANKANIEALVPYLNEYLPQYGINDLLRVSHFLGQAAEESADFMTLKEYASGSEYEDRRDLGNIYPGDGPRYKGRGIFQLTGRANYESVGKALGLDLVNHPELAETPEVAVRTACEYWKSRNLQVYADRDDIRSMTLHINGGYNGLTTRTTFTNKAKVVLKVLF